MTTVAEQFGRWLVPRRMRVYGTAIPAVMLVCWGASLVVQSSAEGTDFLSFYVAGKRVAEGTTELLYSTDAQVRTHTALTGRDAVASPFLNPPLFAVFFAPLSRLPYGVALSVWRALGVLGLLATVALCRRSIASLDRYSWRQLSWMAISFYPTLLWVFYAQATWLWLLILVTALVLLRVGADFRSGLMLGLMALKPQLALGFALVLLVKGRVRCLFGAVAMAVGLITASYLILPEATLEYATNAHKILTFVTVTHGPPLVPPGAFEGGVQFPKWGMHHVYAFWLLLLGEQCTWAPWLTIVVVGGSAAVALVMWRRTPWNPGSRRWDLAFAATLATGWVAAPHFFHYDLGLGVLPFFLILAHDLPNQSLRVRGWTGLVYVIGFVGVYQTGYHVLLATELGWNRGVVQLSVPVVLAWSWTIASAGGLMERVKKGRPGEMGRP